MPADFWLAVAGQLIALLGAAIHLERRMTRLEVNVRWLMQRARHHPDPEHG
ncbi:MAG: hypothetical protein ACREU1_13115 [Burkholderiales bacterium]